MPQSFPAFFRAATGNAPYDYQSRLACGEPLEGEPPGKPRPCESQLIAIPTGLGKTAAVVLAWLWNYLRSAQIGPAAAQPTWPRRLVNYRPARAFPRICPTPSGIIMREPPLLRA